MAVDFRLLSETPYQGATNVAENMLQRQHQARMQAAQIASQEAQTMYTTQAQQQENALNRGQRAQGDMLSYIQEQQKMQAAQQQQTFTNQLDLRKQGLEESKFGLDIDRFGLDVNKENFSQLMKLADNDRQQDVHNWQMFDNKKKQLLEQAVGEAFQQGGYGAAAQVMGSMGLPGEAAKLMIQQKQADQITADIQSKMLQGQKTVWEIQDMKDKKDTLQFSTALNSYVNTIAGTQDPGLQQEMMVTANHALKEKYGIDYSPLLETPEGQKVFMSTLLKMGNDFNNQLGYKANDPAKDFQTAQDLEAALGPSNPYMRGFAQGFQPMQRGPSTVIQMPGTDKEGNVVFANTNTTATNLQERLQKNQDALARLNEIDVNANPELLTMWSKGEQWAADAVSKLGYSPEWAKEAITKAENFIPAMEQDLALVLKDISGAAVQKDEFERWQKMYISGELAPDRYVARMARLKNSLTKQIQRDIDRAQAGGNVVSKSSGAYADLSDADLDAELAKYGY
jgi:hypothetical protein